MSVLRGNLELLQSNKIIIVDVSDEPISDSDLVSIYRWLDTMEFSRPKKTAVHRDFADGVMMAELVAHYIPKIVNTRNYVSASNTKTKISNWTHINEKVFKRLRFQLTPSLIKCITDARPGMIERVLQPLRLILLRGPKAVAPPSSKLENVKSRFMDIERTYLKRSTTPTPPAFPSASSPRVSTSTKSSTPTASRFRSQSPTRAKLSPKNVNSNQMGARNRPTTSIQSSSKYTAKANKQPNKPNTAPVIHHQPTFATKKMSSQKYNDTTSPTPKTATQAEDYGEKQTILSRPSTAISSAVSLSPKSQPETEDVQPETETPLQETCNSRHVPKRIFPPRSSWLPVDDEPSVLDTPQKGEEIPNSDSERGDAVTDECVDEESVDDEIYCSGYDADEDGAVDASCLEDSFEDEEEVSSKGKPSKRKIKRVIKYEYREEYILNGMASYQLPNEQDLENIRKNYRSPGNQDPNCRGYGFV
ncbi:unnamed protein product [Orchesella dallaii]|uniref:CH-like domain-containing protein n=1 Tax=Orchesella dallaii TaxID=48710 RepID=A0ABP1PS51_9HEXA